MVTPSEEAQLNKAHKYFPAKGRTKDQGYSGVERSSFLPFFINREILGQIISVRYTVLVNCHMFKLTEKLDLEAKLFSPSPVPYRPKNVYLQVSSKAPCLGMGWAS